jgi:hypothetical protein
VNVAGVAEQKRAPAPKMAGDPSMDAEQRNPARIGEVRPRRQACVDQRLTMREARLAGPVIGWHWRE